MHSLDGDLEKRAKNARDKAERVFYGASDEEDEHLLRLWLYLSREYNIPLFDDYFKNRTFDELIFEIELIALFKKNQMDKSKTGEDSVKHIMKDSSNRNELSELAAMWEEEDRKASDFAKKQAILRGEKLPEIQEKNTESKGKGWQEVKTDDSIVSDEEFSELERQFMESNEFIDPNAVKGKKDDK